ncbi:attacin-A [Scaptodrosophila lebanonensis]|uniref:Attacin-A n=1 Tax=Drosophila lebanonensis TaxID=7225 RepID=A0A6J2TD83_DROLE|nr:attacin-A [Scaptodrosophila lebanonensis]
MDCGSSVTISAEKAQVQAHCGVKKGDDLVNARAGVSAAGQVPNGPVTTSVYGQLNANGHSLSVERGHTQGLSTATTVAGNASLLANKHHELNANAFHSHIKPNHGPSFDKMGGGLSYQSAGGHAANVGVSHIPQAHMTTMNAGASANLWTSSSGNSSLNANTNAMRHMSGPFKGRNDFGGGFNFQHRF